MPVVDPSAAGSLALPLVLVLALPAFGAAFLLLGGRRTDRFGHLLGCATVVGSFICSTVAVLRDPRPRRRRPADQPDLWTWFSAGDWTVELGLLYDPLSALFLLLITGVGGLIHVYSIGYMEHDERRRRFFAYLNLFVASMLMLVLASDYVGVFLGWEGVGLASYLLIGFWQYKPSAAAAAKKAFVINRVGDIGLSLGIGLIFVTFGTTSFEKVSELTGGASQSVMTAIGLLLLLAACGKSAQFPLQTWLLDAMEGPTPVSALIHAATMVTAGVYLIVRSQFIFEYSADARLAVAVVGTITLLMGAWIGCAKDDIKKVLAGSTMSQIGYMVLAAGLGVAGYAFAIFHLLTHGFFKANMFLGAGSVMHGTNDDVDMRHYGALRKLMPVTFLTFAMGYLAIIGFPGFSGFWSKDKIIETALAAEPLARHLRAARRRRHRVLHDPADADDLLHQGALGGRRAPPRVAEGDDHPPDRARRALGARRRCSSSTTGSSTFLEPVTGVPPHEEPPLPAIVISHARRPGGRGRRRRSPGSCSGGVTCRGPRRPRSRCSPRPAATSSTATRSTTRSSSGPASSSPPGSPPSTGRRRRRRSWARPPPSAACPADCDCAQNGFVRSYALSLLCGAALVLLALVVVNLG